jgi:hypothetical protein
MEDNKYNFQFVVESGYKTSYINSLLMGLFYKSNINLETLINNYPDNPSALYLQELVKDNFISLVRKHFSIKNSNINQIRNYIFINNITNNDIDTFFVKQEDIGNFYKYIIDFLNGEYIHFEVFKITDNTISIKNNNLRIPYITFNPTKNISIRELFINWIEKYISKNNVYCYKLINIPSYVSFYINRYNNNGKKIEYEIDIMKKIKFFNVNDSTQKYIQWKIHSIICNEGDDFETSNYYSVITDYNNNWYMFNDKNIPCMSTIDMSNDDVIDKIRKECMFVTYVIND